MIDSFIIIPKNLSNYFSFFSDTFVTTQLCENDRLFLTRKTSIVRQLCNPLYRQTVKYLTSDVSRRILVTKVFTRMSPETKYDSQDLSEECMGIASIDIDKLEMRQLLVGWYKLFPANS